ncbi:MAG: caspase family protein [Pseudomonadota bacterium]
MADWAALFVGINNYPTGYKLKHAVSDAMRLSEALGYENFPKNTLYLSPTPQGSDKYRLHRSQETITEEGLRDNIKTLMKAEQPNIMFYFSGHANMDWETGEGYLKTPDQFGNNKGYPFSELMKEAKKAAENNSNVFIILDACQSGGVGEEESGNSSLPKNITIMAASRTFEDALEEYGLGGVFTRLLIEGLKGGAADLAGRITAPSLYTYVDTMLTNLHQRPVFKTNVARMLTLKEIETTLPVSTLRNLPKLFKEETSIIILDPGYEPTCRDELPAKYQNTVRNDRKVEDYEQFRHLNRHGMLVPIGTEFLYYAAFENKGVQLTELGRMYHKLGKMGALG